MHGTWEARSCVPVCLCHQTVKSLEAGSMSPSSLYPQGWHRRVLSKASLAHSLRARRASASEAGQVLPSDLDFSPQVHCQPRIPLLPTSSCKSLRKTCLGIPFWHKGGAKAGPRVLGCWWVPAVDGELGSDTILLSPPPPFFLPPSASFSTLSPWGRREAIVVLARPRLQSCLCRYQIETLASRQPP